MTNQGAYGSRLGQAFGMSDASTLIMPRHEKPTQAVTGISCRRNFGRTASIPREDAYLVGLQLRACQNNDIDLRLEARSDVGREGSLSLPDAVLAAQGARRCSKGSRLARNRGTSQSTWGCDRRSGRATSAYIADSRNDEAAGSDRVIRGSRLPRAYRPCGTSLWRPALDSRRSQRLPCAVAGKTREGPDERQLERENATQPPGGRMRLVSPTLRARLPAVDRSSSAPLAAAIPRGASSGTSGQRDTAAGGYRDRVWICRSESLHASLYCVNGSKPERVAPNGWCNRGFDQWCCRTVEIAGHSPAEPELTSFSSSAGGQTNTPTK